MTQRIDEIDKRVLYRLTKDARTLSAPMIAEEMNVSAGTIRNRIKKLEEQGIITGYHANIDYERTDGRLTNLFVCTASVPEHETVALSVLDIPGVINVRELLTGRGNLHVKAVGTDTDDLMRIARELTTLVLEIEDEYLMQNEIFQPYHPFGPEDKHESHLLTDVRSLPGDAEVIELTVTESAPIAGRTLTQAAEEDLLGKDMLVIAIERDETILTPHGRTEIRPDDIVSIFSGKEASNKALEAFEA